MDRSNRGLAALLVLGVAGLLSPLVGAFNRPEGVAGLPLLPLYLFSTWGVLVLGAWLLTRRKR
ncbi:MAG: hypothetical protein SCH98_15665 [Deferrisomatales bacterium]|nr:hypothetical protein [Deferrisomatales bacterium]